MYNFEDLIVWQKADELAFQIYQVTKNFPIEERYILIAQLKRATLSVLTNIAEGSGRQGKKEPKPFTNVALGSLAEVSSLLRFSKRLNLLTDEEGLKLSSLRKEAGALLWRSYKSF